MPTDPALTEAHRLADRMRQLRCLKDALLTPGLDALFTTDDYAYALAHLAEQAIQTAEAAVRWQEAHLTPPHPEEDE